MPLATGQTLQNKYRLERLIGEGGFGYVYQATDLLLNRRVAIKELKPEVSRDSEAFQRFLREAQVAGAIQHPNIVAVHGMEFVEGNYYIVMEYMDGGSLADLLRSRGYLTPSDATNIALVILDALAAVHAHSIIHRDIKPSNVLFSASGRVKLGDFGIARQSAPGLQSLTQTGMVLGTIEYMAPELARGERADERSDVYAVGALLYETLAGRRYLDFGNNTFLNLEMVKTRAPLPLPPSVPRPLASVAMKALAKSRAARFQSASEMSTALKTANITALTRSGPVRHSAQMSALLPLAAAFVGVLIFVLAFLAVRLQSASLAQTQQTQAAMTEIVMSRAATAAISTTAPMSTVMPIVPTAIATAIPNDTVSPTTVPSPTLVPTPHPTLPSTGNQSFLPLSIGNRWVYTGSSLPGDLAVEVVGTETISATTTFAVEFSIPGNVWWKNNYAESVRDQTLYLYGYIPITLGSRPTDATPVLLNPPVPVMGFDPKPGDRWSDAIQVNTLSGSGISEVIDKEKVTVQAGTFDTLKARYEIDTSQWRMEVVGWYTQGVGMVKMEMTAGAVSVPMELKEYSAKPLQTR